MRQAIVRTEQRFYFLSTWVGFIQRLSDNEQLKLYKAIANYGLYRIEATGLRGEAKEYFVSVIRPELDMQHKKRKECVQS